MALGYILMAARDHSNEHQLHLPGILVDDVFSDALTPMAGIGAAIGWGVKRGVYSNEAGQGTGPHAAAASEVEHPAQQGLVQAFSVYVDTLFVCSATAFMILITQQYYVTGLESAVSGGLLGSDVAANSPAFTQLALESVIGDRSARPSSRWPCSSSHSPRCWPTTILPRRTWPISAGHSGFPHEITVLKIPAVERRCFTVPMRTADLAWGLGDIGVGLMAWLNIIGILILFFMGKPALKALRDYEEQRKAGVTEYTFDPDKLGIRNADFWRRK